ncbi:MAG: tandem-95 repeat protein [Desulfobulbaceae bacterium]|nr:tandem-95 repeat protein [Desulfobulbaceae bacterium]
MTKVVSQPLQPEQLPSQQQGAIIASINVEQTFTGPGAGLMMAALLAEGALAEQVKAISASVDAANKKSNNQAVDNFLAVKASADASGKDENPTGNSESPAKPPAEPPTLAERLAALTNLDEVKRFLDTNWEKLRDEAATNFMPGLGVNSADILGADLRSAMSENARNFDPNFPDAFPLLTTVDSLPHSNANSLDPSFLPSFYQPAARSSSGSGPTNSEYLTNSNTSTSSGQTKNPVTAPNSSANSHSPANAPTPEMPPLPLGARLTMSEDTALRLTSQQLLDTAAFSAEAGQFVSLGESKHGQAWIDDKGDIRFQPETNYHGAASFSYFIRQPDGTVVEKLAAIAVENVNDAPNLAADAFIIKQGEAVFLDAFLKNDADTDGDGLVLDHIRGLEHGEIVEIDGRLAFAPALDFTGEIELSYFAKDHYDAYPSRAVVKITVLDADTAVQTTADRFLTPEGETLVINPEDIVKNDHEFDDGMINFAGLGQTLHGAVEILADGTISFRPETGYIGAEAGFYYRVSDSCGQESLGWVSVGLVDVRHAPTALAANFNIQNNESILFDAETVAQFVYDADGDALFLESISGENGAVTVDGLLYRFTPTPGFTGVTTLHYRVNDGLGGVLDGDLRITIAAVDQAVQCGADVCDAVEEQTVILQPETLVENDRDPEGGEVSFLGLGAAKFGTAILNDAGAIEFTPDKDYFGDEAGFFYQVQDEAGNVSESWVQIDLANVDDRPEIIADSLTINEDESLAFTPEVIGQFLRDGDGDTLLLTSLTVNAPPSPLAPLPQAGEGAKNCRPLSRRRANWRRLAQGAAWWWKKMAFLPSLPRRIIMVPSLFPTRREMTRARKSPVFSI